MHRCCINPSILSSCPSTIGNLSTSPTYNLICSGARQHALPVASRCDCAWCPSPWPSGLEADGMPCFRFHLDFTKSSEFFIHSVSIWILFLYICEIHRGTTQPTSATLNFLLRTGRVHWVPSMVKRKKPTELRAPTSAASVSKVHPNHCNKKLENGWKWCLLNLTSTDSGVCGCFLCFLAAKKPSFTCLL